MESVFIVAGPAFGQRVVVATHNPERARKAILFLPPRNGRTGSKKGSSSRLKPAIGFEYLAGNLVPAVDHPGQVLGGESSKERKFGSF